ncbi:MAG: ABC transporter substrate-binding protein [Clostridia bacterium]|nr:ABC transporter substrate-binding protein [Deltaproteobacteria bacterium]
MKTFIFAAVAALTLWSTAAGAEVPAAAEAQKPIKTLINSIRYTKDDLATKQVAYDVMVEKLLGDAWKTASDADKKEITANMEQLIRCISFPAGRDIFKYLDNVLYDAPRVDGEATKVKSTVVIHRELKKSEIVIDWVVTRSPSQPSSKPGSSTWKVLDTVIQGESTLAGIRDDQVKPLLKEGGLPAVKKAMNDKIGEACKK